MVHTLTSQNKVKCLLFFFIKIAISKKTIIPANTEVIAKGKLIGDSSHIMNALVEPFISKHTETLLVAKALVDPSNGNIPVRIANITDQDKTINKLTYTATCEIVRVNDEDSDICRVFQTSECDDNYPEIPTHLQDLCARSCINIDDFQLEQVKSILIKHKNTFSKTKNDLGRATAIRHKINTGTALPIKQQPRRLPFSKREEVDREIQRLLDCGLIEPSKSPWAAPIVLVKKKDGSSRLCIDYRMLNNVTLKDSYPLPRIDDSLDALRGAKWYSVLDLSSGYFQVEMDQDDKEKTAFTTTRGLFHFNVMAMGLCNGVATFQRLMEYVLFGLNWQTCLIYIDDIIIFADSFESHLSRLSEVLDKIASHGLKVSPKKCHLFQEKVSFLGHIVSRDGIATDPMKIETIKTWPIPKNIKGVRSFLGTCSYYRRFIKDFATIAKPLHRLTEKSLRFEWTNECDKSFHELKLALMSSPILGYPDMAKPFILDTDASGYGVGAVLSQLENGKEMVVAYYSKSLSKTERQYCVTRRELLAVVMGIKHFHHYLYGTKFLVRTDHSALNWLLRFRNPEGQMARWLEVLNTYNFEVRHRPGRLHGNADGLSRRPCFPCNHCNKQDQNEFNNTDIDRCVKITQETDSSQNNETEKASITTWLVQKTNVEIKEAQKADQILTVLHDMKSKGTGRPKWQDIAIQNTHVKRYWSQWDRILLQDDILYRKWFNTNTEDTVLQLMVPQIWQKEILELLHDRPMSGHLGINKTIARVQQRFYWLDYKLDITKLINGCQLCGARKQPPRKAKGKMMQYHVGAPMERVALDIVGPFPISNHGNKYILVVTDYFTRWVEGYPMANAETTTIVDLFITNFICRFGVPRQIHTDQGRQFESGLFKELCRKLSIDKTRTTAFRPQSDGLVERFNRTLEDILSKYINKNQKDWDEQLPFALMAYRSSVQETTKFSPSLLMLGREVELPIDIIYGTHPQHSEFSVKNKATNDYVDKLQNQMWKVHEKAKSNILKASGNQKRQYDVKYYQNKYKVGDAVWLHTFNRTKYKSPKLQRNWDGPYFIVAVLSDLIYKIQKSTLSKSQVIHHDRLKPYYGEVANWVVKQNDENQRTESSEGQ